MKAKYLFILSAALNLILVLYIIRLGMTKPETGKDPSVQSVSAPHSSVSSADARPAASISTTNTLIRTFTWEQVESPDYLEYIANLRSIGCPEETIRDIIVADVNKLYAAKKREMRPEHKKFEYWKAGNPFMSSVDTNYLAQSRALETEKFAVLRQLGIEPDARMQMSSLVDAAASLDNIFGFLPEEKQMRVMQIMQDMQSELVDAAGDAGFDPEAMQEAQRKMELAIKGVLTPEEFQDYELRMSTTANTMRSQLAGWDPDEQEFLEVFELRKAFDEEYSMFSRGDETEAERKQRAEAQQQLNEAIKQALGNEDYKAYERAQDWQFQQIYQAARRADLGTTEAVKVYEMQQAAEQEARNLRVNQDLTQEQRAAALEGIQTETERSMKAVLGEEGWKQYDRGYNTTWLRNLAPPTPQPAQ